MMYSGIKFGPIMTFNLSTEQWLAGLELEEYQPLLKKYDMTEDLLHWNETDLQTVGVTNPAHRARLASNLVFIREKLKRNTCNAAPAYIGTYAPLQFSPRTPKTPLSGNPSSPSTRFSFRYSTIPEGVNSEIPLCPTKPKMDVQNASPDELRKELEKEFRLPNNDVRSHAWFHGGIAREKAEKMVKQDGDFLVRDSISKPGNYVLTVVWRGAPMHFVINKVLSNPHAQYATFQYQFEKECFDSVPALIRFHIGNRKTISQASKAIVTNPINRTVPLSCMDGRYAMYSQSEVDSQSTYMTLPKVITPKRRPLPPVQQDIQMRLRSGSIPTIPTPVVASLTHQPIERSESQPSMSPVSPVIPSLPEELTDTNYSTNYSTNLSNNRTGSEPILNENTSPLRRPLSNLKCSGSDSNLLINRQDPAYRQLPTFPTPKSLDSVMPEESLYSEIKQLGPVPIQYTSLRGKSEENLHFIPEDKLDRRKKILSDTRNSTLDTLDGAYSQMATDTKNEKITKSLCLLINPEEKSVFDPESFQSDWFTGENKPLDAKIVMETRELILKTNPLTLAKHFTFVDLQVCRIHCTENNNLPIGMELLTLPQGCQFRQDILERYDCLKIWVCISVFTSPDLPTRLKVMEHWISVADALRTNFGNLFGFCAIMNGLVSKEMMTVRSLWDALRAQHTNSAVLFDTKLRSLMKSLNTGENAIPITKICIPHIMPITKLLERDWSYLSEHDWSKPLSKETLENFPTGETWEDSAVNFGLDAMYSHLQNAHMFAQQASLYNMNSRAKLSKFEPDNRLLDIFRTEFHLRFLWGSKGAVVDSTERHKKFAMVLHVMSNKMEDAGRIV